MAYAPGKGLRLAYVCRSELTLTQAHVGELTLTLSLSLYLALSRFLTIPLSLHPFFLRPPCPAAHMLTYIYI